MNYPTEPKRYKFQIDHEWNGEWVTQSAHHHLDDAMGALKDWRDYLMGDTRVLDSVTGEDYYYWRHYE